MNIKNSLKKAIAAFSPSEKLIFGLSVIVFLLSAFSIFWKLNKSFLIEIPASGGEIKEGVIGYPYDINPLLNVTDSGRDISSLVYSGLMKASANGELVTDLAKSYTVSDDGLTYTFILKDNAYFHDGKPVTAEDIEFTVKKAMDRALKSPRFANWDGVSVTVQDPKTISFTLSRPYALFLENTTIGILPKHIWEHVDSKIFNLISFNQVPVGSGPYQVTEIKRDSAGLPTYYKLSAFSKYVDKKAYISNIYFYFFDNEENLLTAYSQGTIDAVNSISTQHIDELGSSTILKNSIINRSPLPRVFSVFLNQNQSDVLVLPEVRDALSEVVDKDYIINKVLKSYGTSISTPFPDFENTQSKTISTTTQKERLASAQKILTDAGWKLNDQHIMVKSGKTKKDKDTILTITLTTPDNADIKKVAVIIADEWKSLGVQVQVKTFDIATLNQNVIRPRKYEALLFGEIVGRDPDPYAFWHSSQRNDPGLNIGMYANVKADKLLESARKEFDKSKRIDIYNQFLNELSKDNPAIFLYTPDFIYVTPKSVKGIVLKKIMNSSERFLGITDWYIKTDSVWSIFVKK